MMEANHHIPQFFPTIDLIQTRDLLMQVKNAFHKHENYWNSLKTKYLLKYEIIVFGPIYYIQKNFEEGFTIELSFQICNNQKMKNLNNSVTPQEHDIEILKVLEIFTTKEKKIDDRDVCTLSLQEVLHPLHDVHIASLSTGKI